MTNLNEHISPDKERQRDAVRDQPLSEQGGSDDSEKSSGSLLPASPGVNAIAPFDEPFLPVAPPL